MKKRWTEEDDRVLRESKGLLPAAEIAKRLGRSLTAVYNRCKALRIVNKNLSDDEIEKLKPLFHSGKTDTRISEEVGIDRRTLSDIRNRLGIPSVGMTDERRKNIAVASEKALKRKGLSSMGQLRAEAYKEFNRRYGWPECVSLRGCQILEVLYRLGPMTKRQLANAVGVEYRGKRTFSNNRVPGQSYTAELVRRGLVFELPKAIFKDGKNTKESLYLLAIGVEPCPKARERLRLSERAK